MEIETQKRVNIKALSSWELISLLKREDLGIELEKSVFTEFHRRFVNKFFQKCLHACLSNGFGHDVAEDIFQESFIKFIKNIKKFEIEESLPEKKIENSIIAWFGVTANRELINFLRKNKTTEPIHEEYEEIEDVCKDDPYEEIEIEEDVSEVRIQLRRAMATLSEREKYILLVSANYDCLGNKNHLPDDVLDDICKQFSISKNNVKQIRFRAYKKIQSMISVK